MILSDTLLQPLFWRLPVEPPRLAGDDIHVWRVDLNERFNDVRPFLRVLNTAELARAERFRFQKDRHRFVLARGILRMILGSYLDAEPRRLQISCGPYGKPFLDDPDKKKGLRFNLSHSNSLILYAVAREREVGIDVEYVREELAVESLAKHVLSQREFERIFKRSPNQQTEAFFDCWTRKEAYIKAVGKGLSLPLDQFEVPAVPDEPTRQVREIEDLSEWSLFGLSPGPGYVAAIAIEGGGCRLSYWQWSKMDCKYKDT